MTIPDETYHEERARHCRTMANRSEDGTIKRIHEQLADLHEMSRLQRAHNSETRPRA